MYKRILLITAIAAIASNVCADAQRDGGRHYKKGVTSIIVNERADSADNVEKAFKGNAPTSPKENNLPRFAIVGKERQFYLGIGAQFLGEAVFDWGDNMPSALDFIPSSMTARSAGNGSKLSFTWQSSSIHLNFIAMPHTNKQIGLYFKGDFNSSGGFKVSHLYVRYRGLTTGYTKSSFTDGSAQPFTIDDQGPNGYPSLTLFTAYWTRNFGRGISATIGVDAPTADFTASSTAKYVNQRIPAVPFNVRFAYNGGIDHIRLAGIVRPMQYRNTIEKHNSTLVGLGIQLSGITEIAGPVSLTYNATYGRGIAGYIHDDKGIGIDATASATDGRMTMSATLGITGGLLYDFNGKVSANLVYSHITNWLGHNAAPQPDQYRFGDYVAANVIYNINRFLSAGLEYDYGHAKSFAGNPLLSNRIQAQFALTF